MRRLSLAVPTYQLPFQKRFRKSLCLPLQIRLSGKCLESQWPTESATRQPWSSYVLLKRQSMELNPFSEPAVQRTQSSLLLYLFV